MTPDEAVTAVLRSSAKEIARGLAPEKATAYDGFVELCQERADEAMQNWNFLIGSRQKITGSEAARMERDAYDAILQLAVAANLALAHFPFLDRIEFDLKSEMAKMI